MEAASERLRDAVETDEIVDDLIADGSDGESLKGIDETELIVPELAEEKAADAPVARG